MFTNSDNIIRGLLTFTLGAAVFAILAGAWAGRLWAAGFNADLFGKN